LINAFKPTMTADACRGGNGWVHWERNANFYRYTGRFSSTLHWLCQVEINLVYWKISNL